MDKKLVLSPDQVTKIVLDKPKMDLSVTQKARTLTVRRVVGSTGTPGITYSMGRDKEPLVVDVVDPADPAKVLIGRKNMEYG
jgi:Fe-S cluster assembly iron-binding protein IscA